jgi:hypothetical protein
MSMTTEERRHLAACERAGCTHPAFYFCEEDESLPLIAGYCDRCRAVEFGSAGIDPDVRRRALGEL